MKKLCGSFVLAAFFSIAAFADIPPLRTPFPTPVPPPPVEARSGKTAALDELGFANATGMRAQAVVGGLFLSLAAIFAGVRLFGSRRDSGQAKAGA